MKDMKGMRFERLVVIERSGTQCQQALWLCVCDCKTEIKALGQNLRSGRTKSCGCLRLETNTKHDQHRTSEYKIWVAMRQRCINPNQAAYENYGGRGISVCERWHDFTNFYVDMGKRPSTKYSVERIDNHKGYNPENCKWATRTEQSINQRLSKRNTSGHKGVDWDKRSAKWCSRVTIYGKTIHLGYYEKIEDAIEARKYGEIKYWEKSS